MTPRENALAVINWKQPEYIPMDAEAYHMCRFATGVVDQPWEGGTDAFGIRWEVTPEGALPAPGTVIFDDISEWREHVRFPDLDKIDFESMAAKELIFADRSQKLIGVLSVCGSFERLVSFMGFENALCALIEDPESCKEYFHSMADFRIKFFEKVIDAYKPDVVTYFDDVATQRSMFMSPEIYREIIKPALKRIVDYVSSRGVIFSQHCCGMCADVLQDYVDCGVKIWSSAQKENDLIAVKEKFRGKLVIEGGWDTTGPCSWIGGSVDEAIAEAKRCIREYGPGGGFIMQITLMNENGNSLRCGDPRVDEIMRIWKEISAY